ncbi:hypothetical protein F385_2083 [Pantoea agglomerans 299R]|nr:hypothetical protein F385_2083 [Pantoea agglomerans 299R]
MFKSASSASMPAMTVTALVLPGYPVYLTRSRRGRNDKSD